MHRYGQSQSLPQPRTTSSRLTKLLSIYVLVVVGTVIMVKALVADSPAVDPPKTNKPHHRTLRILLSEPRSGSSWIGHFFDAHPHVFYVYEPLHPQVYLASPLHLTTRKYQEEILRSLCLCEFSPEILSHGLTDKAGKIQAISQFGKSPSPEFLEAVCKGSQNTVAKVLQLDSVETLKSLSKECDIEVVHLVRDPRASIISRMNNFQRFMANDPEQGEFTPAEIAVAAAKICDKITQTQRDLESISNFVASSTIKYETVAKQPLEQIKDLFKRFGVRWHPNVEQRVQISTSGESVGGGFDIVKDTANVYGQWRNVVDPEFVRVVESSCSEMMSRFGYAPSHSNDD